MPHLSSFERHMAKERRRRTIERALFIGIIILAISLVFAVVYLYV